VYRSRRSPCRTTSYSVAEHDAESVRGHCDDLANPVVWMLDQKSDPRSALRSSRPLICFLDPRVCSVPAPVTPSSLGRSRLAQHDRANTSRVGYGCNRVPDRRRSHRAGRTLAPRADRSTWSCVPNWLRSTKEYTPSTPTHLGSSCGSDNPTPGRLARPARPCCVPVGRPCPRSSAPATGPRRLRAPPYCPAPMPGLGLLGLCCT